jgi:LacI family transcriptional regulator
VPTERGRATLAAVAASAGVSIATASKVLNGRSDVSSSTRARVQAALRQHDYVGRRPEPVGRPTVELFFQGVVNAYSVEVIAGVLEAGSAAGVDVVVSSHPRSGRAGSWVRDVATAGRQAVIGVTSQLTATDLSALSRARLPLVVIDPLNVAQPDVTSVGSTNFSGGLAATEHLLSLGHCRIAYLGGPATADCNQARVQGFRGAMEAAGAPVPEEYVRCRDFLYADGLAGGAALLDLPEPPTAVFAGSDEVALGVIEAARGRGLRVPEDLSVVGFDDTQVARLASPQLTTVRQPLQEMGAVALRTALRLAAGEKVDSHHVELATTLVVRGSTAAPAYWAAAVS